MKPLKVIPLPRNKKKKADYDRFIRVDEVLYRVGFSRTTLYRKMCDLENPFPSQIKISEAMVVWSERDVVAWMEKQKDLRGGD